MPHREDISCILSVENRITLNEVVVSYRVRRSLRARRVHLEIVPDSGLVVVIPRFCSLKRVPNVLKEKQSWVIAACSRYNQMRTRCSRKELEAGDIIPYLGREVTIMFEQGQSDDGHVSVEQDRLIVTNAATVTGLKAALEQWYRAEAVRLIADKVDQWSGQIGVKQNSVHIRGQRTRWGSCSHNGSLSFNWKLLMAPEAVIDYVVIHELSHRREMNHSKRFWCVVAEHCPQWREQKRWLKTHEVELLVGLYALRRDK